MGSRLALAFVKFDIHTLEGVVRFAYYIHRYRVSYGPEGPLNPNKWFLQIIRPYVPTPGWSAALSCFEEAFSYFLKTQNYMAGKLQDTLFSDSYLAHVIFFTVTDSVVITSSGWSQRVVK